jgi:hypothetical protein
MLIAAAMSTVADPRKNQGTMFSGAGRCPTDAGGKPSECFVIDNRHAIASGTSMAAPVVAGAVALLLEQQPHLTQADVLRFIQAGARRVQGTVLIEQQAGPGALDVNGAFDALSAEESPIEREPVPEQSWLALASAYARPDPSYPLVGMLQLRAADGSRADGFDADRLRLEASPANVSSPLRRVAAGLWRFELTAPAATGGLDMRVRVLFDEQVIAARSLPIAVDHAVAGEGFSARGGCAVARSEQTRAPPFLLAAFALAATARRRQSKRAT